MRPFVCGSHDNVHVRRGGDVQMDERDKEVRAYVRDAQDTFGVRRRHLVQVGEHGGDEGWDDGDAWDA